MDISVIVCTFNRSESLGKTLESIAASILPPSIQWELLEVDNNSTDRTRVTVDAIIRRHPHRIRYAFEPVQGKSHALNTGIRESSGQILAFTDDDVVVEATWLRNLTGAMRDGAYAAAGGRILPPPGFAPPAWLPISGPRSLACVIPVLDMGPARVKFEDSPIGANMAFRREMFQKYGYFRTDFGPRPGSQLRNEDSEFCRRLIAAGESILYEPSAVVYHEVVEARLRKEYCLHWMFEQGRASVLMHERGPNVWGIPRPYLSILKTVITRLGYVSTRWLLAMRPDNRFFYKSSVWMAAGQITEFYTLARTRREARGNA